MTDFISMTNLLREHLQKRLTEILQKTVNPINEKQVHGGDINQTYILETNAGKFFIKINDSALAGIFQKEYYGLATLQEKSILKIPKPIHWGNFENNIYLIMECLEPATPNLQTWKQLGEGIALLHQQTQDKFGLDYNNFIGSLPQQNLLTDTWAEFYATQRILPLVQQAFDTHQCTTNDIRDAEKLCARFNDLFPDEPPALLHGDLWSGNIMACANSEAAIYDPAIYYGHREMDIAMTLLFGGFDAAFYRHYQEAYPLQSGWQNRVDICQLYPLLFHLNLFGSSYYGRVKAILDKYK